MSDAMPETLYGLVEMLLVFGLVVAFCVYQLWSVERTRARLRKEQSQDEARD